MYLFTIIYYSIVFTIMYYLFRFDVTHAFSPSLFPTMPRHNYSLAAPLVRRVCEEHGVPYQVKTLGAGFRDVVG